MKTRSIRPITPEPAGAAPTSRPRRANPPPSHACSQAVCLGFALALCLIPIRAAILGFDLGSLARPFEELPRITLGAGYDSLFVAIVTTPFLLVLWLLTSWPRTQRIILGCYVLLAIALLLIGMANVEIVRMLGRPFNYQWFYYSDFLRNRDALNSIRTALDWKLASLATWLCLAMLILSKLAHWTLLLLDRRGVRRATVVAAALPLTCAYLFFAHWFLVTQQWPVGKIANPVSAFASSLLQSMKAAALFTMSTPVSSAEFEAPAPRERIAPAPRDPQVRNVILFVLESVPAEYVPAYGGRYPVTPNLNKYLDRAAVFEGIYSHAAATNKSLVSLLCSAYPWVSYRTLTQEHPDAPLAALSAQFRQSGRRTAFFASGDLVYQGAGNFLAHRGFDLIQDYRQRRNSRREFDSKEYPYLNGTDDRATVQSLLEWIDKKEQQPFFAMLWTLTTHHPYFCADQEIDYGVSDKSFNRYLNALRHTDQALGEMLEALERRQLLDSTLVVVVGDHGEAFGRHNQWGHGTQLYEENLRVPLILINPKLFKSERRQLVGGLVDVAPTVADLLGIAAPGSWQGRSLFSSDRAGRVYFFAPWSDFLFGYREGDWKLIFNATTNRVEVYDLKSDPFEVNNLASAHPQFVTRGQQHLAAWVQAQARFYARAFGESVPELGESPPAEASLRTDTINR